MSNAPITVLGRALPEAVTKNIIKGPIVLSELVGDSGDTRPSVGFNQAIYKVKLVANGRTFNMLLPPSIESKHPGRSNPLQLPGLQIESTSAISKLKIPGFFPIYQHLGVESLYISMSGMFTGYDGENKISTAGNWEGWDNLDVKGGQDAYTAACDLFDFAVTNKAITTVTISTSDGSFDPKKSTTTNFRDEQSNIRFKGYIKELKQIYIRQDRVYYMLKFEIIDLGNAKQCVSAKGKLIDNNLLTETATKGLNIINNPLTPEDIAYLTPNDLEKAKLLIDKINKGQKIVNADISVLDSSSLQAQIAIYAENKGQNADKLYSYIINQDLPELTKKDILVNPQKEVYIASKYKTNILLICERLGSPCEAHKTKIQQDELLINTEVTNKETTKPFPSLVSSIPITDTSTNQNSINSPVIQPIREISQAQTIINTKVYDKDFTNKYITNERILVRKDQANRDFKIYPEFKSSIYVIYKGNANRGDSVYPILEIRNFDTGLNI